MGATDAYAIFAEMRDPVIVADSGGTVSFRNKAAAALIGDAKDWRACFGTDGAAAEAARQRVLAIRETAELEWTLVTETGSRLMFASQLTWIDGSVLCISRDITQLTRTEERLRFAEKLMVDTQGVAHLGTWEWDISQPSATWSAELYKIYGLTPETYTPSYEQYLTMVHPDDRQRVIDATNRVFHEHVPYSHDERIFRPDGTMRYLHTWAYPLLDAHGKLTHLIGVCQDITDRALAEEALQRANAELEDRVSQRTQQLERALRDLEAFNAMVSHDLRAPLAVIQMAAELLDRDPAVDKAGIRKYIDRITKSIASMSGLLGDLLSFARVGETALQPVEIDVTAMATEIAAELQATAPEREITFAIQPGVTVVADPAMFRIVLGNLMGNAWKYTLHRPQARIEVAMADVPSGRALSVKDNGVGFDMAEYPKLFTPFSRLSSARDFPGTGVGLATVQRILERHGGSIAADGQPGVGATFYIELSRR